MRHQEHSAFLGFGVSLSWFASLVCISILQNANIAAAFPPVLHVCVLLVDQDLLHQHDSVYLRFHDPDIWIMLLSC